jgi:hypothetical protein
MQDEAVVFVIVVESSEVLFLRGLLIWNAVLGCAGSFIISIAPVCVDVLLMEFIGDRSASVAQASEDNPVQLTHGRRLHWFSISAKGCYIPFYYLMAFFFTASVVWWSEFLATDPEVRVRFQAIPEKKK